MSFTVRDKSGKVLGSFDLPTLIQMAKDSRLSGNEEFQGSDKNWKPLSSHPEVSPFLTSIVSKDNSNSPVDLMGLFDDVNESENNDSPDFTLSPTDSGAKTAKTDTSDATIAAESPPMEPLAPPGSDSAPSPSTPADPALEALWQDDEGKPFSGDEKQTPPNEETVMGEPPLQSSSDVPSSDSTVTGDPPGSGSSLKAENLFDQPTEDAQDLAPPLETQQGLPENALEDSIENKTDSKDDFLQFPDQPTNSSPNPSSSESKGGLEDLFSPSEETTRSSPASAAPEIEKNSPPTSTTPSLPGVQGTLDGLLDSSPDAFAADLTMPDAPKPSPPRTPAKPISSQGASGPGATTKSPATKEAPKTTAQAKKKILKKEKSPSVKRKTVQSGKSSFLLRGLTIVLLLGLGAGAYVYFINPSSKKILTDKAPFLSQKKEGLDLQQKMEELKEKSNQLMKKDNYGAYLEAAKEYKEIQNLEPLNKAPYLAKQLEALVRSQFQLVRATTISSELKDLFSKVAKIDPPNVSALRAAGAFYILNQNYPIAREVLFKALESASGDSPTQDLIGDSYLFENDFDNAKIHYNLALKANPGNLHALYGLGLIPQIQGQNAEIEHSLKNLLELSPGHIPARVDLGQFYFNQGKFNEAEKNLILITGKQGNEASPPQLARSHFLIGLILKNQGKTQEAGINFQRAVETDASNPIMLFEFGNFLLHTNKIEEAKNQFMAAIQIDKKADYIVGYATAMIQEKKFGDAKLWLQQAIRLDTNHALAHLQLGNVHKELGDVSSAISHYRKSENFDPKNLETVLALAKTFEGMNKNDLATVEYQKAVALAPKNPDIHISYGDLLTKKNQFQQAAKEYNQAVEYTEDIKKRAEINYKLGKVLLAQGKIDSAIDALQSSVRLNSRSIDSNTTLGIAFYEKGNFTKAQEILEATKDLNPEGDQILVLKYHLGNTYTASGDFEKALKNYQQILEARPNFAMVNFRLGILYYKQNIYLKAIEEFDIALPKLKSDEDKYKALLSIGQCHFALGNHLQAEKIFLNAVKKYPKKSEAYFQLGKIYDDQQLVHQAIKFYKNSITLNRKDDRPHYYLGFAYKALNQRKLSLDHFRQALALNPRSKNAEEIKTEIQHLNRGF